MTIGQQKGDDHWWYLLSFSTECHGYETEESPAAGRGTATRAPTVSWTGSRHGDQMTGTAETTAAGAAATPGTGETTGTVTGVLLSASLALAAHYQIDVCFACQHWARSANCDVGPTLLPRRHEARWRQQLHPVLGV